MLLSESQELLHRHHRNPRSFTATDNWHTLLHLVLPGTIVYPHFHRMLYTRLQMSSITSPRPSLSIRSPSASSRNSLDVPTIRSTNSRRNRAALRDYYGLKGASSRDPSPAARQAETLQEEREVSELDKEGFDAAAYVKGVLTKQNLEGVLRVEAGLLSGINTSAWI